MKALVLCGGMPQIALIKDLKSRGIYTILADMNEKVAAREYADEFFPVSVLDVEAVYELAKNEKVDIVITVCADQVLQVVAEVSERLGLPCYIDFETAENVSKKSYMKRIFKENSVPTSSFVIMDEFDEKKLEGLVYPLIVKPVDAYSSRGVKKVFNIEETEQAVLEAINISRTSYAIVEEFVEGDELTVDIYVEAGEAKVLCISKLDKIGEDGKFVIHRSTYPACISTAVEDKIKDAAQKIAEGFKLENCPMLIQLINKGEDISVVEFCARTGGGVKFRHIKRVTGFDVVKAVVELALGEKPHYEKPECEQKYIINEFFYCMPGVFDHMEGLEQLLEDKVISEYYILKPKGHEFTAIRSSSDRVACYTIEAQSRDELREKQLIANRAVKAVSNEGKDLIRHDLIEKE